MRLELLGGLILLCLSSAALAGPSKNLISGLGFDQAKPAFLTGYLRTTDGTADDGHYGIGTDASQFNSNWPSNIQAPSGDSMMFVNGATAADVIVWDSGPIRVKPHTTYFFGAYVTSLFGTSPPVLVFRVNGTPAGKGFHPSQTVGEWTQYDTIWNSGSSTRASISIVDQNTDFYGNDFALGDLSLADSPVFITAHHVITMRVPSSLLLTPQSVAFRQK